MAKEKQQTQRESQQKKAIKNCKMLLHIIYIVCMNIVLYTF